MMLHVSNDRYMCPNCHTAEYIREDIDGHHCAMCGIVVCEDVYRTDQSFDPTTHRVQGTFIRAANTRCKTARRATAETRIRNLAERLRLDKSYESEMMHYMNVLFANEATERIWNQGRYGEMVIGALAFIVCRNKGVAVTFQDICDGLSAREKISEYELSRVYYRVATVLNTDSPKVVTPSSWVKRAIFKLYSEGACGDDGNEDSDSAFEDDGDDVGGNNNNNNNNDDDSDTKAFYASYYITPESQNKAALSRKGGENCGGGGTKKLKLKAEEKPQITVMATRILQIATKYWITVGKKPMPVVAAAIVLAIEYYHSADDVLREVSERLHAAKSTVNKRCSEILQRFSASLKEMGFKSVRNRKDVVKHIPLALMYFDVIDSNDIKPSTTTTISSTTSSSLSSTLSSSTLTSSSSSSSSSSSLPLLSTSGSQVVKGDPAVSRRMLPASFVKNERMRQERRILIEQCKRLNQAICDGTPFPEDIPLTDEVMLIGTLLFEGVPEDVIANCQLETLKAMRAGGADSSFVPLGSSSNNNNNNARALPVPRRRVLKRYEKKKKRPAAAQALLREFSAAGAGDAEEEIGDFSWDEEVANCLREEKDRRLVGRVVEGREKQAAAEKARLREEAAENGEVDENGRPVGAQPRRKMAKAEKRLSTKINRQRLSEFLSNEKHKMFEDPMGAKPLALDAHAQDQQNNEDDGDNGGNNTKQQQNGQRQLLTRSTDSIAGAGDEGEENDYDCDVYLSDLYAIDEDLDIRF